MDVTRDPKMLDRAQKVLARKPRTFAFSVHLLTASGAAFALLAMLAAVQSNWQMMFVWLLAALIVDGIDGPLARLAHVKIHAASWDGATLDLVIDYLTYVFIPAFALAWSGLFPEPWGMVAGFVVALTGVLYFADTRMKLADNSFRGFPGCWNMVVLVLFAVEPVAWIGLSVIAALALAQFLPLVFIHPVRTRRWRRLNLPMTGLWVVLALWAVSADFRQPALVGQLFLAVSLYLLLVGLVLQALARWQTGSGASRARD